MKKKKMRQPRGEKYDERINIISLTISTIALSNLRKSDVIQAPFVDEIVNIFLFISFTCTFIHSGYIFGMTWIAHD